MESSDGGASDSATARGWSFDSGMVVVLSSSSDGGASDSTTASMGVSSASAVDNLRRFCGSCCNNGDCAVVLLVADCTSKDEMRTEAARPITITAAAALMDFRLVILLLYLLFAQDDNDIMNLRCEYDEDEDTMIYCYCYCDGEWGIECIMLALAVIVLKLLMGE